MSLPPRELDRFVDALVARRELWEHHVRHADDVHVFEQIWDRDRSAG